MLNNEHDEITKFSNFLDSLQHLKTPKEKLEAMNNYLTNLTISDLESMLHKKFVVALVSLLETDSFESADLGVMRAYLKDHKVGMDENYYRNNGQEDPTETLAEKLRRMEVEVGKDN